MTPEPGACEHLAYEIDLAARIVTVVYIGIFSDEEVINFYADLIERHDVAPSCDYLVDMRYTEWRAKADVIAAIDGLFTRKHTDHRRRIAIVRKAVLAMNKQQEAALREGLDARDLRYFTDMDVAAAWLRAEPAN